MEIRTSNETGERRTVDTGDLWFPDNTPAHAIDDPWRLYKKLAELKVSRIQPGMGKSQLLFLFGVWQQESREDKRAKARGGVK